LLRHSNALHSVTIRPDDLHVIHMQQGTTEFTTVYYIRCSKVNVKLTLYVTRYWVMKMYGGLEV